MIKQISVLGLDAESKQSLGEVSDPGGHPSQDNVPVFVMQINAVIHCILLNFIVQGQVICAPVLLKYIYFLP